jgi:hypothetical protein
VAALRGALVLIGCLVMLGAAGWLATLAMHSTSVSPTQLATASVVVDSNQPGGSARLTVLAPVKVAAPAGSRVVPAGTEFVTTNATLTGALPPPGAAAVGSTLSCDLRVGAASATPIIDVVSCVPAATSPRG